SDCALTRRIIMRLFFALILTLAAVPSFYSQQSQPAKPLRPVHTFSIVARDPATGELGVAVQSHWFSVGPIVPWAEPGVGAVATQANVQPSYGPHALDLMRAGASAGEALERLVAEDPGSAGRQVAVLDASGRVAVHTGSSAIPFAGHSTGEEVSCQANMMASETVWPAMLDSYRQTAGSLARRLLAALDAA